MNYNYTDDYSDKSDSGNGITVPRNQDYISEITLKYIIPKETINLYKISNEIINNMYTT